MSIIPTLLLLFLSAIIVTQGNEKVNPFGISLEAYKYCPFTPSNPNDWNYTRVVVKKAYKQSVNNNTYIIIKLKGNCFSNISEMSPKRVPIVVTDLDEQNPLWRKYPKCGEWKPKVWRLKEYTEYEFPKDSDYSGSYWKNGEFQGFNTDWLGCPQDMCLNANIDAIIYDYTFRGRFVYKTHEFQGIYTVKPASDVFQNKSFDGYIDTTFDAIRATRYSMKYIIKKNMFWWAETDETYNMIFGPNDTIGLPVNEVFGNNLPQNIDLIIEDVIGSTVYFFKDDQYMTGKTCFDCKPINQTFQPIGNYSEWHSVKTLNPHFPNKVNGIVWTYLYSGWKYYDIPFWGISFEKAVENYVFEPKWIFKDRFKCTDESYKKKGFKSFEDFIQLYTNRTVVSTPKPTEKITTKTTEKTSKKDNGINWTAIIVLIVIIIALIVIIAILLYFHFRPKPESVVAAMDEIDRQILEYKSEEDPKDLVLTVEEQRHLPLSDPRRTFDRQTSQSTQISPVVPQTQSVGHSKPSPQPTTSQASAAASAQTPNVSPKRGSAVPQTSGTLQSQSRQI